MDTKYDILTSIPIVFDQSYQYGDIFDDLALDETQPRKNGWDENGFMSMMECHALKSFHVYFDDEIAAILSRQRQEIKQPFILLSEEDGL